MTAVFDSKGSIAYENNEIWGSTLLVILGEDTASEEYLEFLRKRRSLLPLQEKMVMTSKSA